MTGSEVVREEVLECNSQERTFISLSSNDLAVTPESFRPVTVTRATELTARRVRENDFLSSCGSLVYTLKL